MALSIKYTKAQYLAIIADLEGYKAQLESHLDRMEDYQSQINQFWDDENASTTYAALSTEIRQVRSAMDNTENTLRFYRSAVEKLDGANINAASAIQDALGILGKIGL